jgi:hypothetical protein
MPDDEKTPIELLGEYPPLREAIGPLLILLQINWNLATDILALAMVMGIHAAETRRRRDAAEELVREDMNRGLRELRWPGQS